MPVDIHVRAAAWLHIALGVLAACVLAVAGMILGVFGAAAIGSAAHGGDVGILGWIAGMGMTLFLVLLVFPVLEIVGGALLLGGSPAGKVITLIFSVLGLVNIPIGTAVGLYSLWALLREVPPAATVAMPAASTPPL